MQIMYQEESPGSCPDLFIDGEKVELLGRQDVFEELDQKRLYPADGSLAKLKLPGEVFSDEGDAPEIEYQICYIDEACGQKVCGRSLLSAGAWYMSLESRVIRLFCIGHASRPRKHTLWPRHLL